MSPVWTRSGSRPINHGCSVRDPRPGSPSLNPSPAPKSVRRSVTDAPSGPRFAASRRAPNLTGHLATRVWAGSPVNDWSKVDGVRAPLPGPPYPVADGLQCPLLGACTAPICAWPSASAARCCGAGAAPMWAWRRHTVDRCFRTDDHGPELLEQPDRPAIRLNEIGDAASDVLAVVCGRLAGLSVVLREDTGKPFEIDPDPSIV